MADQLTNSSTLLIVDDDPDMVRMLTKTTEHTFGDLMRVQSATDPELARQRINSGGIDILLTDLEMPQCDGIELLRYAKCRNAYTQVIFLTGHSSHQALLTALESGATDYVLKPVNDQSLLGLLKEAHQRRIRWQQALLTTWQQQKHAHAVESVLVARRNGANTL